MSKRYFKATFSNGKTFLRATAREYATGWYVNFTTSKYLLREGANGFCGAGKVPPKYDDLPVEVVPAIEITKQEHDQIKKEQHEAAKADFFSKAPADWEDCIDCCMLWGRAGNELVKQQKIERRTIDNGFNAMGTKQQEHQWRRAA